MRTGEVYKVKGPFPDEENWWRPFHLGRTIVITHVTMLRVSFVYAGDRSGDCNQAIRADMEKHIQMGRIMKVDMEDVPALPREPRMEYHVTDPLQGAISSPTALADYLNDKAKSGGGWRFVATVQAPMNGQFFVFEREVRE